MAMPGSSLSQPLTPDQQVIVTNNLGLVGEMLKRMGVRQGEWDDCFQLGVMALMRAARGFKPELGFKFSTYACRAILLNVSRDLQKRRRTERRFRATEIAGEKMTALDVVTSPDDTLVSVFGRADVITINQCLEKLDHRSQTVLRHRFGFDGTPATLETVGRRIGLTKERVRQIEAGALESLRRYMAA